MKNILIVGHTSVDNIITPYMEKKNVLGGAALYSSLSSRIFTDKIKILTAIGKDFPDGYKHVLQRID
ncbi:MAG: sugar kinase, partial [Candidatus Nanoarchaeia archaeon]|nr:sugar kinase [Candidatus Jingweiarchaeum tengchongense]